MPNQPKTTAPNRKRPVRSVGVREELWAPAVEKARDNGETIADVIERALKSYLLSKSGSAARCPVPLFVMTTPPP